MPIDLLPTEATCDVTLVNGEKVTLEMRPFTLADLAFMQREFSSDEEREKILSFDIYSLCKIIWNILKPESKVLFGNIKFSEYDEENNKVVIVNVFGYKKLVHAIAKPDDIIKAFSIYSQMESVNSFLPKNIKKKTR